MDLGYLAFSVLQMHAYDLHCETHPSMNTTLNTNIISKQNCPFQY